MPSGMAKVCFINTQPNRRALGIVRHHWSRVVASALILFVVLGLSPFQVHERRGRPLSRTARGASYN